MTLIVALAGLDGLPGWGSVSGGCHDVESCQARLLSIIEDIHASFLEFGHVCVERLSA
jgi:hypothetical protein